jgi:predicted phosphodiesterase
MRVAAFGDVQAHGDALTAVMAAAVDADVSELWSLGDLVGTGPDPARAVGLVRAYCTVALAGNHDYGVTRSVDPALFGPPGSAAARSLELAARQIASEDLGWLASRKPAARRHGLQCWHASPRHPVWDFVTAANAAECLQRQRERLGIVGHTHAPVAWLTDPGGGARAVRVRVDQPLPLTDRKWLLNPGAVGAPTPPVRGDWWAAMDAHARAGAWWLELDLTERVAIWRRAQFDPAPALARARALGLVEDGDDSARARPVATAVAERAPGAVPGYEADHAPIPAGDLAAVDAQSPT